MNRQQRREIDRQAEKAIETIKYNLEWLNAAGNPKYKLVVQSSFGYKVKRLAHRLKFWG